LRFDSDKHACPAQLAAVGIKHEIFELKGQWFSQFVLKPAQLHPTKIKGISI
jgi:hypothetical protein